MILEMMTLHNYLFLFIIILLPKLSEATLTTITFIYFDNVEQDFESRGWLNTSSLFQTNIAAVGTYFKQYINSSSPNNNNNNNIELITYIIASRNFARAGGSFNVGTLIGNNTKTGLDIYEPSSLTKLKTGSNYYNNNNEIYIYFNAQFVEENYWFDPTPDDREDIVIPNTKVDFLSVVLHEFGHGLGIAGTINLSPGTNYGKYTGTNYTYMTVFDERSSFGGDGNALDTVTGIPNPMYFNGPVSEKVNGGQKVRLTNVPINDPLYSENFYHLGDCSSPTILEDSLMSGCYTPLGPEYISITCIDLAILADLGYTMTILFNETCLVSPTTPIEVPTTTPIKVPTAAPIDVTTIAPVNTPANTSTTAPVNTPIMVPSSTSNSNCSTGTWFWYLFLFQWLWLLPMIVGYYW